MKKLRLLSFSLVGIAAIVVLISFKTATAQLSQIGDNQTTSGEIYLDYKPIPWACLHPNGAVQSYVNGCASSGGSYCERGICPIGTVVADNPAIPVNQARKLTNVKPPLVK